MKKIIGAFCLFLSLTGIAIVMVGKSSPYFLFVDGMLFVLAIYWFNN